MQRYFLPEENWHGSIVYISGDDFHHIVHVMRMVEGDEVICNHPNGKAAIARINKVGTDDVEADIKEWLEESKELPIDVCVVQGLPKGDKWEFILQKGTELGASSFVPYQAERSIVKWDAKKVKKKHSRWGKIVKEASEQSHRNKIPHVAYVHTFQQILELSEKFDWKFIAYEEEVRDRQNIKLHDYFSQIQEGQSVMICIGPEGGFSTEEVDQWKQASFQTIRLGRRILRTETAPLYALSSLSYYFEEMR
nr:16S rRNA (uracil(1498)-N(3))-methyltransferase [Gracilibacillus sp. YIM 98692]